MAKPKETSAQDQALLAMATEANAKAKKLEAEVRKVQSEIELNAAKTAETYSDVDMANLKRVKDTLETQQKQLEQRQEEQKQLQQQLMAQIGGGRLPQGLARPQIPGMTV